MSEDTNDILIDFSCETVTGVSPFTVHFQNKSPNCIVHFKWDFKDHGVYDSDLDNPSYTYYNPGVYSVTLTASDGNTIYTIKKENFITVLAPDIPPNKLFPVSKDNDPFFDQVSLLLHLTDIPKNVFYDYSPRFKNVEVFGSVNINDAFYQFGSSCCQFENLFGSISVLPNIDFQFNNNDFTIELWIDIPENLKKDSVILDLSTVDGGVRLGLNSELQLLYNNDLIITTKSLVKNVWTHVVLERHDSLVSIYINGEKFGSVIDDSIKNQNAFLTLGCDYLMENYININIDSLRITKGIARYKRNFPIPTDQFATDSETDIFYENTSILLLMNGENYFIPAIDYCSNPKLIQGNITLDQSLYKYNNGSCHFNGFNESLGIMVENNNDFVFDKYDFTIEVSIYLTETPTGDYTVFDSRTNINDNIGKIHFGINSSNQLFYTSDVNLISSKRITLNTWIHVALVRSNKWILFYINGLQAGFVYDDSEKTHSPVIYIGESCDLNQTKFKGYMTDYRVTNGIGRYIGNYTK
jgi:PKD repeat protein